MWKYFQPRKQSSGSTNIVGKRNMQAVLFKQFSKILSNYYCSGMHARCALVHSLVHWLIKVCMSATSGHGHGCRQAEGHISHERTWP